MKRLFLLAQLSLLLISCGSFNKNKKAVKTSHYPGTEIVRQTVEYNNGKKNGYLNEYFRNGKLKARQFYVNDTLHDTTLIFHGNGHLATLHIYKMGKREGKWTDFNPE